MSTKLDSVDIRFAPETIGSGQSVLAAVASVWRRKLLVLGIVAAALALGIMAVVVMPERYKAQAYIRGEFFAAPDTIAKDADSTTAGSLSLDLVRVLETQSRLLESRLLARRVVEHLGLERLRPIVSRPPLLSVSFFGGADKKATGDEIDSAAARLLEDLSVTSDPRAYLLTVSYRAGKPELAELITNAFVAELLRSAKLQALFKQRSLAQATLSIQLAKFGDKHPNVAQAKLRLTATDEALKKQLNEDYGTILKAAGENVTKAVSGPISFKFVIVLLLLGGLVVGVGAALWLERDRWYAH
jgi:uncharacterized protein involved in exopolysaccharide biosynthesis